jgi:glucose/arabinose dehydrogenase
MKVLVLTFALGWGVYPAVLLPGFTETQIASGLSSPTALTVAPDGRVFITEQGGQLRVVAGGSLLVTPALSLSVDSSGERGLIGVTLDPNFSSNNFIYLQYTVPGSGPTAPFNRVSRFTMSGNAVAPGSEVIVRDLDPLSGATNHNGGALRFGADGRLYVATGDNANGTNAQTLANQLGKILRLNPDGTIPSDNPFVSTPGAIQSIWALGLRNPFQIAVDPLTGGLYINDVGQSSFEEINQGGAGRNYGWPATEGSFNPASFPNFTNPLYAYDHGVNGGCAITGGAFSLSGIYYFADFCSGFIRTFDPNTQLAAAFASSLPFGLTDLAFSPGQDLYYLFTGNGAGAGGLFLINFPDAPEVPEPSTFVLTGCALLWGWKKYAG